MTAGVTVSVALYVMIKKADSEYLISGFWAFFCPCLFIILLFCLSIWAFKFSALASFSSAILAVISCAFLILATYSLAKGVEDHIEVDDYVLGVVTIHVDIIGDFLFLIAVCADARNHRRR